MDSELLGALRRRLSVCNLDPYTATELAWAIKSLVVLLEEGDAVEAGRRFSVAAELLRQVGCSDPHRLLCEILTEDLGVLRTTDTELCAVRMPSGAEG